MFGTLVVQLPTAQGHEGGALIVRHRKHQRVFAWQDPDGSYARGISAGGAGSLPFLPVRCAAFYGDCEHELQPVTAGVRLCLLFNLVRTTSGAPPSAAAVSGQRRSDSQRRFSRAMAAWGRPGSSSSSSSGSGCDADKLILPLEHEYTKASLDFDGLKGRDRAVADALRACREVSLYLATVVKHESGTAAEDGYYDRWSRRRDRDRYGYGRKRRKSCGWFDDDEDEDEDGDDDDDDDEYDSESDAEGKVMEEVYDTTVDMEGMTDPDGESPDLGIGRDVGDNEVVDYLSGDAGDDDYRYLLGAGGGGGGGLDVLFPEDAEPDEREYEGYTGNCSPTLDFWYRKAVLVLWPASAAVRVALRSGADVAIRVARRRSAALGDTGAVPLVDLATIVSLAERKAAGQPGQRRSSSSYHRRSADGRAFAEESSLAVDVLGLCASKGASGVHCSRRLLRVLAGEGLTPAPAAAAAASAAAPAAAAAPAVTVGRAPGLRSGEVARAVAALVRAVGWPAVGEDVSRLVKACGLEQGGNVSVLVHELSSLPLPLQQPDLAHHDVGSEAEVKVDQPQQQSGDGFKTEIRAAQKQEQQQQLECQESGGSVKEEVHGGQDQGTSDSTGLTPSAPPPPSASASPPGPASQQQHQQQHEQQQQPPGTVYKVEAKVGQLQQQLAAPVAEAGASSSVGALIAGTYVHGATSNPAALERVTTGALPAAVRELLLDRDCFANSPGSAGGANPLLRSFASVGSVRFQPQVLAAAVHQFRLQLGRPAPANNNAGTASAPRPYPPPPPPHHSSAVVTLATGFLTRGFQDLEPSVVKTFAEDLLWLSDVLWRAARSEGANGLEQWFTGAVLTGAKSGDPGRADKGHGQLKAVLESRAVQAAVRGGRDGRARALWRSLAEERLGKLEKRAAPVMCWRQPDAVFAGERKLQAAAPEYCSVGFLVCLGSLSRCCRQWWGRMGWCCRRRGVRSRYQISKFDRFLPVQRREQPWAEGLGKGRSLLACPYCLTVGQSKHGITDGMDRFLLRIGTPSSIIWELCVFAAHITGICEENNLPHLFLLLFGLL